MSVLVLTVLLVLWAISTTVAVSLCIVAARADRIEGARRGRALRLLPGR